VAWRGVPLRADGRAWYHGTHSEAADMRTFNRLLTAGIGAVALAIGANRADAAFFNLSSTVGQSGTTVLQDGGPYPLTGIATPYDFNGQVNDFAQVTAIDILTVTVTSILDGDTGPGDFDEGDLTLALDGIDTGLALDGLGNNAIASVTLTRLGPALQAALIAALADGKLVGTIRDADADNPGGDLIGISALDTTLDLTVTAPPLGGPPGGGGGNPVPLPAAALLGPLGAGVAGICSRRFRRAK
jgi:hypothetical protein